jgi:hypothetical protein
LGFQAAVGVRAATALRGGVLATPRAARSECADRLLMRITERGHQLELLGLVLF